MDQLTRNRLIGGSVLLFAGLLFLPVILNPDDSQLSNPDLSLGAKTDKPVVKVSTENQKIPEVPTLELSSVESDVADTAVTPGSQKKQKEQLLPVSLESLSGDAVAQKTGLTKKNTSKQHVTLQNKASTVKKATAKVVAKNNTEKQTASKTTKTSWIRVGSFADENNANKLAALLKRQRYSVKIEKTSVGDTIYQRVLVGPFTDEKKMQAALARIAADGKYAPSIQR